MAKKKIEAKEKRGGARPGAGRKPRFSEETVTVQFLCPASKEKEFRKYCNDKLDTYAVGGKKPNK